MAAGAVEVASRSRKARARSKSAEEAVELAIVLGTNVAGSEGKGWRKSKESTEWGLWRFGSECRESCTLGIEALRTK